MSIVVMEPKSKDFAPAPEGLRQAVCCDVVDLGDLETEWGMKRKIDIRWQTEQVSDQGFSFLVKKRYTLSLHEKASLRKDVEAWLGRKLTQKERGGFVVDTLIGQNCQIQIVHNTTDQGKTYANVQVIVPLGKGMAPISIQDGYVRVCERPVTEDAE